MGSKLKNLNIILFFFSFLLIGCSSTYRTTDFSSREKFYEDFNKSSNGKPVKIYLVNDSSFIAEGAEVVNDSLLFIGQSRKERITLSKNDIKNIHFYYDKSNGTYSAKIFLNSGGIIKEDNVVLLPDSSISYEAYKYGSLPLNKIKKVFYKNNLLGAGIGFLSGTAIGFFIGLAVAESFLGKNSGSTPIYYFLSIQVFSSLVGSVWGWIQGYTYTYQFNP